MTHRTLTRIILAGASLVLAVAPAAQAQWSSTLFGVAEYDTKSTLLLLAGVNASPGGAGVKPLLSLQAYHLGYDVGSERRTSFTIKPAVGLRNGFEGGSMYATVGYAFANREEDQAVAAAADRGDGVVLSAGVDHWGTGERLGWQALGSYNFGSESYWTRGRVTTRVGDPSPTATRIGAEVALLGGDNYTVWQPGGVIEWRLPSGAGIGLGAGAKLFDGGDNAAYFKVEGSLPLGRR